MNFEDKIYRDWIISRFLEIRTSDQYDKDLPLPVKIGLHFYKRGVEIELTFAKYTLVIFLGYQEIIILDERNGITTTERNR